MGIRMDMQLLKVQRVFPIFIEPFKVYFILELIIGKSLKYL
jgi:hypothetical protein